LACAAGANSASASSKVEDNFMAISALGWCTARRTAQAPRRTLWYRLGRPAT
jgi:hypothetical protein